MGYNFKTLFAVCVIAGLTIHGTDAQVSFLPVSDNLAENSATVSTTLTGSGGTGSHTFLSVSQTPALAWFDVSSTGIISIASGKTVNYEDAGMTTHFYKILVEVKDSTPVTALSATVTFTYTITNVNEVPVFGSGDASAVKFTASQAAGSTIATTAATDPESGTITYSIGDTTNFAISTVGVVTVNTGVNLANTTKYTEVYAADVGTPALTATTHLFVCIGTSCSCSTCNACNPCNAAAAITGSVITAIGVLVTLLIKLT